MRKWTNIVVGLNLLVVYRPYHVMKIVADFDTNEHVRVILNENTWDLSGNVLRDSAAFVGPMIQGTIRVISDNVGPGSFTADRAILTQNEPL
ncbi:unnamed protein product [marine sediment metagenome]|uniref:Uncharacterized protein n=1 Tax=marine sediment metagenome TaxID=412755 RepID=X0ZWB6_9ZZZZ